MQPTTFLNWRDHLAVHPAAEAFPLLSEKELKELADDIERNDLRTDFVLWRSNNKGPSVLLDGRNRLDALAMLDRLALNGAVLCIKRADGSLRDVMSFKTVTGGDPEKLVDSLNLWRRHLSPEQRRDRIAALIKADPSKSNRQVAETVGVSHTHVNKVRAEMEKAGDVETVSTSIDTKGRKQPAKKKTRRRAFYIDTEEDGKRKRLYGDAARARLEELEKERVAVDKRVAKILIDRIGIEGLTLVYAAQHVSDVWLRDLIDVPGSYGAEVCATVDEDKYTLDDFLTKYETAAPADDGGDTRAEPGAIKKAPRCPCDKWPACGCKRDLDCTEQPALPIIADGLDIPDCLRRDRVQP